MGKYAQIPVGLSKSVLAELSAPEFRVWFALCLQCQHWSNGTGKLCRSVIREFHLGSQRVVTAATKLLIAGNYIVMTRAARQRRCALYGVTHLPLNTEAMAKEGIDETEIRATLKRFGDAVSDSKRGSADGATTTEAQNDKNDNRGSANTPEQALALPKTHTSASKSPSLALPQGNTSKNLPSTGASEGRSVDVEVGRMILVQGHLPDADVATSLAVDISRVARVRARIAQGWRP
jgi:hypothetical protein